MPFQRSLDRRLLSLALIAVVSNASYTTIAPILPLEIDKHYISELWVSVIFLAYPVGFSLSSPTVARNLESWGTATVTSLGMVLISLLFYWLSFVFDLPGLVNLDDDDDNQGSSHRSSHLLIVILTVTQFFLGGSMSMITTGYYSMATLLFPLEKESAMSYIESAVGTGYIIGPVIGSTMYDQKGFSYAYKFVSIGLMTMAFITWKFLSPYLKCKDNETEEIESFNFESRDLALKSIMDGTKQKNTDSRENQKNPTTISLLRHPEISSAALTILWISASWFFLEPILAKGLTNLNVGKQDIGMIFALPNLIYVPTVFLIQYVPKQYVKKHKVITISLLLTPISVLLLGAHSFSTMKIGILLLGLFPTPVWVYLLPSMQEDASILFSNPQDARLINDLTAGIYNSFITLGQVVGYIIGPLVNESYGVTITTQVVAVLIFLQSIVYYSSIRAKNVSVKSRRK